jgi:hypothetical protein
MTVSKDVADNAINLRIVSWHGTVEIEAKGFTDVGGVIPVFHLLLGRQALGLDGEAGIAELIASLVADCKVELPVGTKFEASAQMVVAGRQTRDDVDGI